MPRNRVVIVGGGITGLSAAYYLERSSDCEITLLEPGPPGGKVSTVHENGCLMELGPDCFFARKPEAMALIRSLGIEDEVIEPKASGFSIMVDGELHEVPHSVINFTCVDWAALDAATFLSPNGKGRAEVEPLQPAGGGKDESIGSFFRRRFGEEFSRKVVEPLMAGTHGGRADSLSVQALYPTYVELERKQGSLNLERKDDRGKRKDGPGPEAAASRIEESAVKPAHSKAQATFLSLKQGMGLLPKRLIGSLNRTAIQFATATRVSARGVETEAGFVEADVVLSTVPAFAAAKLLTDCAPNLAAELTHLEFVGSRIITFCFNRSDIGRELKGTGFLVPQGEDEIISGCTYASEKWEGRASADKVLLRVFLRGDEAQALPGIQKLLNIKGEPLFCKASYWDQALPQYKVGHLDWLMSLETHLSAHPWLVLAGASYKGVGVPDCIRQGHETAAKITERL